MTAAREEFAKLERNFSLRREAIHEATQPHRRRLHELHVTSKSLRQA